MNLLDVAALAVLLMFILHGLYKGFVGTVLAICACLLSILLALALTPVGSAIVRDDERLFNMMLYYTEGSEFIADAEYVRTPVSSMSAEDIDAMIEGGSLPYPMGPKVRQNIAREAFAADGIVTLGDYYNQTIVRVFINILSFLVFFALLRAIMGFGINAVDYAKHFPVLHANDAGFGALLGVVRGMLALFLLFMLFPIVLTALGQFDFITDLLDNSLFAAFFYRSNLLLGLM